jgi:hypothetical protein
MFENGPNTFLWKLWFCKFKYYVLNIGLRTQHMSPLLGFLTRIRPSTNAYQKKTSKYNTQSLKFKPPATKMTSKMNWIQPRALEQPKTATEHDLYGFIVGLIWLKTCTKYSKKPSSVWAHGRPKLGRWCWIYLGRGTKTPDIHRERVEAASKAQNNYNLYVFVRFLSVFMIYLYI